MGSYDEILDQVPVDQLAGQLGVDSDEVRRAAENALPALLGGLHANASDPAAADSLMAALSDHQAPVTGLDDVDEQDGRAIVGNIFGDNTDQVVSQLGGLRGASGGIVQKLLPILAPIVLSWLAGKVGQGGQGGGQGGGLGGMSGGGEAAAPTGGGSTDGGPLFPGGAGAGSGPVQAPGSATPTGTASTGDATGGASSSSNPLQDILGQVLGGGPGGGASGGSGDILGGLLGGLLGGGKR
ncbi:MAG: DUF937 domain-containing protein [Terrabacter sp.]